MNMTLVQQPKDVGDLPGESNSRLKAARFYPGDERVRERVHPLVLAGKVKIYILALSDYAVGGLDQHVDALFGPNPSQVGDVHPARHGPRCVSDVRCLPFRQAIVNHPRDPGPDARLLKSLESVVRIADEDVHDSGYALAPKAFGDKLLEASMIQTGRVGQPEYNRLFRPPKRAQRIDQSCETRHINDVRFEASASRRYPPVGAKPRPKDHSGFAR